MQLQQCSLQVHLGNSLKQVKDAPRPEPPGAPGPSLVAVLTVALGKVFVMRLLST